MLICWLVYFVHKGKQLCKTFYTAQLNTYHMSSKCLLPHIFESVEHIEHTDLVIHRLTS